MMHRKPKPLTVAINVFLIFTMLLCVFLPSIHAHGAESESTESTDPGNYNIESYTGDLKIVVSLGDSYASGEGVEPFYGQDQIDYKNNIFPEDWRAHRSENSWSSKLHLTFNDGWTMVTLKMPRSIRMVISTSMIHLALSPGSLKLLPVLHPIIGQHHKARPLSTFGIRKKNVSSFPPCQNMPVEALWLSIRLL